MLVRMQLGLPAGEPCLALGRDLLSDDRLRARLAAQPIAHRLDQLAEHQLGVAENPEIGGKGLVQIARVVGRVDVLLAGREYRGGDAVAGKAAADAQHQIGFVQDMAAGPGEGAAARPERQRMILGKGALAVERRHHRGLQQLRELAQLVGRLGIKDALPGEDHRTGSVEQHLRGVVDVALVAGRAGGANRPVLARVHVNLGGSDIGRHLDHDRARAARF